MNTITLPRETVEQVAKDLEDLARRLCEMSGIAMYPERASLLRAALRQAEPLERLTRLTEEMGLYPWQEKSEPQAQAGEPPVVAWAMNRADGRVMDVICPGEHESCEGAYTVPLITLQSNREAMEAQRKAIEFEAWEYRERIVPELRSALKACVEALEIGRDVAQEVATRFHEERSGYRKHEHDAKDADVSKIDAAITQAQGAMK